MVKAHGNVCRNEGKGVTNGSEAHGSARAEIDVEEGGGVLKAGGPPDCAEQGPEEHATHGSARAETLCEEGGGTLKAGRPPDWPTPDEMILEKSEAHGSVCAEVPHNRG